jgi:hypothetical protein
VAAESENSDDSEDELNVKENTCPFQFLQETDFRKTLVYMNIFQRSAGWCTQPAFT